MPLPIRYVESGDDTKKTAPASGDQENDAAPRVEGDSLPKAASLRILDAVVIPSNRLQALGVHNISTVIRQLGSIAQHAESIMGEIADDMISYHQRMVQLEERTRRLKEEVIPSFDPEREAAEGFEIPHPDFHFRSDRHIDQHLLSKQHIPQPLVNQIKAAHTPPLYLLSPLSVEGKNMMLLYSNPDFFFEYWCSSMKKEALRRKSTMDVLSPVAVKQHSKSNGSAKIPRSQDHTRALKRNTKVSKSFHSRTKPPQYGSNLSLQDVGSRSKSSSLHRSYSMRAARHKSVPLKYSGSVKVKGRSKAHGFVRIVAANFEEVDLNLSVVTSDDVRHSSTADRGRSASPLRDEKGRFLSRTFSIRRSRSHSRSRSPNPQVQQSESIFTGSHVYLLETELRRQQRSQLSVLSKQHLENLDLGSADYETYLPSSRKLGSTFKSSHMVSSRPITPIIHRIPTPTLPPPKTAPKRRVSRSSSDAKDKKQSNFFRSATVSGANLEVKRTANKLKNAFTKDGRPASVALEQIPIDVQQTKSDSLPYLRSKTLSQLSLTSRSKPQQNSNSSSPTNKKRHSTALLDEIEPISVSTFTQEPVKKTSQIRHKPRRPAPARPPDDKRPGSKESASPAMSTPNSSPIPGPPPPPRNDSLNSLRNQNETTSTTTTSSTTTTTAATTTATTVVKAPSGGSSPATPGTAHTAQRHSTLDSQKKESVANAISNVLANIARRSLASPQEENPLSPTTPVGFASPMSMMRSGSDSSPYPMSPTGGVNRNTVTSPGTKRSSIMSPTPIASLSRNTVLSPELDAVRLKNKRASLKRQSSKPVPPLLLKQESLYISPRKFSLANHFSPTDKSHNRMGEILKAGGVDAEDHGSGRGDLLVAIRKGLQLRKVEEVTPERERDENIPWDVAAILERYQVLHSDSGGSDSEVDWDELDEL